MAPLSAMFVFTKGNLPHSAHTQVLQERMWRATCTGSDVLIVGNNGGSRNATNLWHINTNEISCFEVKVKSPLCLTKHQAMKTYGVMEV
jgi:hypothetical protein